MIETKYDIINSFTEYKNALESSEENMFMELGHCDGFKAKCEQYGDKNCVSTCQGYEDVLGDDEINDYINHDNKEIFDKLIDLFELHDKLNNLKDEKLPPKDKDCSYIMDFVTSYEKKLEVCLNGNDIDFCNQLEIFKQDYEKKLTQLKCPDNVS
ncbi:PIR Superfamily Protein [Plasmodium ovale curtisi]|uniref:PIR Superfamily Protein n=1 Tax=Plasmodium ovale curtisi TaxID=864141 RepID=A0A1A8WE95_PLAOA|nr:PIR Superfamily Protein [Plasmodium ovale curtisi]